MTYRLSGRARRDLMKSGATSLTTTNLQLTASSISSHSDLSFWVRTLMPEEAGTSFGPAIAAFP